MTIPDKYANISVRTTLPDRPVRTTLPDRPVCKFPNNRENLPEFQTTNDGHGWANDSAAEQLTGLTGNKPTPLIPSREGSL